VVNWQLEVISSCIYDGKDFTTFYLTEFNKESVPSGALLQATIEVLFNYHNYKVYIHAP
jgi:hypothetical protein